MSGFWAWLAVNAPKDVLATVIAGFGARVFAWKPLRDHQRRQDRIADLLDTGTAGGLGDLNAALGDLRGRQ